MRRARCTWRDRAARSSRSPRRSSTASISATRTSMARQTTTVEPLPHNRSETADMTTTTLATTYDGYEVWFVTGSQTMYGEETLRQVAEQSQEVAARLAGMPVRVVWKPVLTDAEGIRRLALDVNARDDVIGLIAWMHTFSPAKMWIGGLDALRKPLLHLHTQTNVELPWAEIDMDSINLTQAAHGDREFGYVQPRLGVARRTVAGHVSDPTVTLRIGTWA